MADPNSDPLARLRTDRVATLAPGAVIGFPMGPILRRQRCAVARQFGAHAAAQCLTWAQVTAFRDVLAERVPLDHRPDDWGRSSIERIAGFGLAHAAPVDCPRTYVAFLEGIEATARACEAAG